MAFGDKHAKLSFSGPPDMVTCNFLRIQGFWLKKNLDLLMAITSQRHEEAANNTSKKLPKPNPEQTKTQTFPDVAFKPDFLCLLDDFRRDM